MLTKAFQLARDGVVSLTRRVPDAFGRDLPNHSVQFIPGSRTLVVSFDFAFAEKGKAKPRLPWGYKFFRNHGFSLLGVMVKRTDWYRDRNLHDFLNALRAGGFFKRFSKTIFAGGSMGGYAATAFASLAPGSVVIAINPQSTLSPDLTPWEKRFPIGRESDWTGSFVDGAHECRTAKMVYIVYDPYYEPDRLHAARFRSGSVVHLHCPFYGHHLPAHLRRIGALKPFMLGACSGTLRTEDFDKLMRARRQDWVYWKKIYERCRARQRTHLACSIARLACQKIPSDSKHRAFFLEQLAQHKAETSSAIEKGAVSAA
jgi:pimeloyl-ACP methyl ester carboxylesterase